MFNNLVTFGYKRSTREAVGFYFAWLFFVAVASAATGAFAGSFIFTDVETFKEGFTEGMKVGALVSLVISTGLAFLLAKEKKILGQFQSILLILLTAILAGLGGGLLGLLIPAYLSTRDSLGEVTTPPLSSEDAPAA